MIRGGFKMSDVWGQVTSGRYPGLVWDDDEQTMFRIPWKHAGKQDFRSDEDAAIFKVHARCHGNIFLFFLFKNSCMQICCT